MCFSEHILFKKSSRDTKHGYYLDKDVNENRASCEILMNHHTIDEKTIKTAVYMTTFSNKKLAANYNSIVQKSLYYLIACDSNRLLMKRERLCDKSDHLTNTTYILRQDFSKFCITHCVYDVRETVVE